MTKNTYKIQNRKEFIVVKSNIEFTQMRKRNKLQILSSLKRDLQDPKYIKSRDYIQESIRMYTMFLKNDREFLVNAHNLVKQFSLNN